MRKGKDIILQSKQIPRARLQEHPNKKMSDNNDDNNNHDSSVTFSPDTREQSIEEGVPSTTSNRQLRHAESSRLSSFPSNMIFAEKVTWMKQNSKCEPWTERDGVMFPMNKSIKFFKINRECKHSSPLPNDCSFCLPSCS